MDTLDTTTIDSQDMDMEALELVYLQMLHEADAHERDFELSCLLPSSISFDPGAVFNWLAQ